jgi:cation:H+ antiporter
VALFVLVQLLAGVALLIAGAEMLVRGASRLASRLGVPSLVIGLTVVALGTSSPEIAVSVVSVLRGHGDVALGNVVGSNIANVLLILGLAAVLAPLRVDRRVLALDVPVMVVVSVVVLVLCLDGRVSRGDGVLLLLVLAGYTATLGRRRRNGAERNEGHARGAGGSGGMAVQVTLVAAGVVVLVLASQWLVAAATAIARMLGASELVIGLTVVALGTSLPEGASSVVAALRGESDIAVGNVVGSNILNLLFVLGLAGALAPHGIAVAPQALHFDIPVMVAVAAACLPVFFTGFRIARWEGALFLAYYTAYLVFLVLAAGHSRALAPFSWVMLGFVVPLTAVTLAVVTWRSVRAQRRGAGEH